MTKKRILIISNDEISSQMGGVGVRNYELARALGQKFQVTLAVPNQTSLAPENFSLQSYEREKSDLRPLALEADVIVTHGFVLHFHPYLKELGIPLAIDLYVPNLLESLVWHNEDDWTAWIPAYEEYLRVQLELVRAGDFFFCASETQRDYWLGWLHAQKRINPHTYQQDPALRRLIDVIPFGIPEGTPTHRRTVLKGIVPGIGAQDKIILWAGGLWDWLDPLTLLHAMKILLTQEPTLKLYFMGMVHPDPIVSGMKMPEQVIQLSRDLQLEGKNVFFGDWVPYQERENYLTEADLSVVTHPEHIETHFSFRTRILDCIWAGLPVVTTQGGAMADWVAAHNLGLAVPPQDAAALATAISEVSKQGRAAYVRQFEHSRTRFRWQRLVEPLENYCQNPVLAPDKAKYLTELERMTLAKDHYHQQVVLDKDNFLAQVIADKDNFLEQVVSEKDKFLQQVIADKDNFLQQVSAEKDRVLEQAVAEKDRIFEQALADKVGFFEQGLVEKDSTLQQVTAENDRILHMVAHKDQLLEQKDQEINRLRQAFEDFRALPVNSPFVSVITVNYNGMHYLSACLDAIKNQTYPPGAYEVIVSDNGSTDGSLELLHSQYPWVRLLENNQNLGFATGNNVAIKVAKGQFIILLNNDTAAEPDFIRKIVDAARLDEQIGLVTGHLRLFYNQLKLEIRTDSFVPENDGRELGVQVFGADSGVFRGVVQYLDGFYGSEPHYSGTKFRWSKGQAVLGIPVPHQETEWTLNLTLAAARPQGEPVQVELFAGGLSLTKFELVGGHPQTILVPIPLAVQKMAQPLQQNAGSIVFRSGAGRDRGTYARNNEMFFAIDEGQYNTPEEVFAGCGASLLLRRSMLDDVGLLDDDFFMYYEDTDLSWRARLKGWKVLYTPDAIVRHIHSGTTPVWSPWFINITERNRLAMVFKNGSLKQILQVVGGFVLLTLRIGVNSLGALLTRKPYWRMLGGQVKIKLRILWALLRWQPALWRKRWQIQTSAKVSVKQIEGWFQEVDS